MPPHVGNVDRVAGPQVSNLRLGPGLMKVRKSHVIRRIQTNHAGQRARQRSLERTDIEISGLAGWKEDEPPSPRDRTGHIGVHVVVGLNDGGVADPKTRHGPTNRHGRCVRGAEAWSRRRFRHGLRRQRRRMLRILQIQ